MFSKTFEEVRQDSRPEKRTNLKSVSFFGNLGGFCRFVPGLAACETSGPIKGRTVCLQLPGQTGRAGRSSLGADLVQLTPIGAVFTIIESH